MNTIKEIFSVERKDIIKDILGKIEQLQSEGLDQPIMNMYGIAGMGKTFALKQLFDTVTASYSVIWLNFAQAKTNDQHALPIDAGALVSLDKALETLRRGFVELQEQLDPPAGDESYTLRVQHSEALGASGPRLLLLDGLDDLPLWRWLQESIIKPLVEEEPQTLIVCASQAPLFWDFWELRDQCQLYEIEPFQKHEISTFLEHYGLSVNLMADTFYDYTQGYPLAVHTLVEQLVGTSQGSTQDVIELPSNLVPEELALLETIGVMRLVEIDVVRTLLVYLGYPADTLTKIMNMLAKLRSASLLNNYRPGQPEQFTRELRNTVRNRLTLERYQQACEALAHMYKQRAKQRPKTAINACIEWLYFATCTWPATLQPHEASARREVLLQELDTLLQKAEYVNKQVIASVGSGNLIPVDASLVVLFYRDRELCAQLAATTYGGSNLFSDIDSAMQGYLKRIQYLLQQEGVEAEIKDLVALPLRNDFDTTCGKVLVQLAERLPTAMLPASLRDEQNFSAAVRAFLIQPDSFDIDNLRREFNASIIVSPHQMRDLFNMFNSRGLFSYDRTERTYTFNKYFKRLVSYGVDRTNTLTRAKGA